MLNRRIIVTPPLLPVFFFSLSLPQEPQAAFRRATLAVVAPKWVSCMRIHTKTDSGGGKGQGWQGGNMEIFTFPTTEHPGRHCGIFECRL